MCVPCYFLPAHVRYPERYVQVRVNKGACENECEPECALILSADVFIPKSSKSESHVLGMLILPHVVVICCGYLLLLLILLLLHLTVVVIIMERTMLP